MNAESADKKTIFLTLFSKICVYLRPKIKCQVARLFFYGRLKVLTRKIAIWARVTLESGQ